MARARRSLQDRIRERQQSGFVGRQGQVIQYEENLAFAVDDERRRFLFNIHGDAGVGKSFLTGQFRQIAAKAGALTAYVDETAEDVTAAMVAVADQFGRAGSRLVDFEKRVTEYRQRRHELESDPHAPSGVAAFLTKTAVSIGLAAARDIPIAGSLLATVDAAAAADQANQAREYLSRKFSDHRDVQLLLSPADAITPAFVAGLNHVTAGRATALFIDTYERTGPLLDQWLRGLYAGRYGDLPETLVTTVAGQKPLDPNLWGEYLPVIADIPLDPFSDAEARQFLASKGIADEPTIQVILTLSGRLPLWLATLADARSQGSADIGDPSGDAVERFLKWENDPARRRIAIAAALPRALNQDVVAAITAPDKAREMFGWLRGLPFVSQRGESWAYHEVVRAAMLRVRRAEAPAEWRSEQSSLAQANANWAEQAVADMNSAWGNPDWVHYKREETYHLLCADPHGNLPRALDSAVKAAEHSLTRARQWAELITEAGRDTSNDRLREWGRRLTDCLTDDGLSRYLTCLINDAALDTVSLVVAYAERGESYRLTGRHDDALADFTRAIGLDPDRAWTIARRGTTYLAIGRHDDALADFTRAIELNPQWAWARVSRGLTYRAMGRLEEALADFTRAVALNPPLDWASVSRGLTHFALGRYEEALADFTRAVALNPSLESAFASRGLTYRTLGRFDEALADFTRAIELNPALDWARASRGLTHLTLGRLEEALADLTRAIEFNPDSGTEIPMIGARGLVYGVMGRFEEALADLTRAIEVDPDGVREVPLISARGLLYGVMGRYDDALASFTRAIELDPVLDWAISGRGLTYLAMGRFAEALADFTRAIELNPGRAPTPFDVRLDLAHLRAGRSGEVLADFTIAVEFDQDRAWITASRGLTYRAAGRLDEALADLTRAVELNPDDHGYVAQLTETRRLAGWPHGC